VFWSGCSQAGWVHLLDHRLTSCFLFFSLLSLLAQGDSTLALEIAAMAALGALADAAR
jgi:hypothetical protein